MPCRWRVLHDSEYSNILSDRGFATALLVAFNCKPGCGISPFAPVCSSWVPVNLGTSKRTFMDPLGDTSLPHVRDGNLMVARVVLLLYVFTALGCPWFLEQPKGSLMQYHPRLRHFNTALSVFRANLCMGCHGGRTKKDTWIQWPTPRRHPPAP